MDMSAAAAMHEMDQASKESKEHPVCMVMPFDRELPDDGVLSYRQVTTVRDLIEEKAPNTVLCFAEDENNLLSMLVDNAVEFGCTPKVLAGVPRVSYDNWWDAIVWKLEKISYTALLSEISLERQAQGERKKRNETKADKEHAQVARADGTVKDHGGFDLALDDE